MEISSHLLNWISQWKRKYSSIRGGFTPDDDIFGNWQMREHPTLIEQWFLAC